MQYLGLYSPWISPGQNTGVGSLSLLQRIFPTQGSNPSLPHCRQILYQLRHTGSPRILKCVDYPFSSGSYQTQESNQGLLHCRWILYQLSHQGSPGRDIVTIKSTSFCFRYLPFPWPEGRDWATVKVKQMSLHWAQHPAWYIHVDQPLLGRISDFSLLKITATLWIIDKWVDPAVQRLDLPVYAQDCILHKHFR